MNDRTDADDPVFRYQPERWPQAWPMFATAAALGVNYIAWTLGAWTTPDIIRDLRAWWLAELLALIVSPQLIDVPRLLGLTQAAKPPVPGSARTTLVIIGLLMAFVITGAIHTAERMELGWLFVAELLWLFALEFWNALRSPPPDPDIAILQSMNQGVVVLFAAMLGLLLLVPLQIVFVLFAIGYDLLHPASTLVEAPPVIALAVAFFTARGLMELYADRAALWRSAIRSDGK